MLRFIILSLFLVGTVMLAPNTNFVVLPATEAHVCADCETQCAYCNLPNNSSSSTGIISVQSQPTTTHIRNTNSENFDSETSTRAKRSIGSILKSEIYDLASGLDSLAKAVDENVGGFFTYLSWTHQHSTFVTDLQSISWEIKELNNFGHDVKTMTEQLASRIVRTNLILNEIADVTLTRSKTQNGGAALKSMASNIEILSSIIKVLGKGLQETETNCINEKNILESTITNLENEVNNLKAKITELIDVEIKTCEQKLKQKDQEIEQFKSSLQILQNRNNHLESVEINKTEEINKLNDVIAKKEISIINLKASLDSNITKLQNSLEILRIKNSHLESVEINKTEEINKLNDVIANKNKEIIDTNDVVANKTKEINELNNVVAIKEISIKNLNTSLEILKSSTDSNTTQLQNNVNDLNDKLRKCNAQQKQIDDSIKDLEEKLKDAESKKIKLEKEINSNENEIKALQASMVNLDAQLASNELLKESLINQNGKYISSIIQYEDTIKLLNSNNITALGGGSKVYEDLISDEKKKIKKNELKIDAIKVDIDKLEKQKQNLQSNIDKELAEVKSLENELETCKNEINNSNLKIQLLVKDKDELVKDILDIKSENDTLEKKFTDIDDQNLNLGNLNRKYVSDIDYLNDRLKRCSC